MGGHSTASNAQNLADPPILVIDLRGELEFLSLPSYSSINLFSLGGPFGINKNALNIAVLYGETRRLHSTDEKCTVSSVFIVITLLAVHKIPILC